MSERLATEMILLRGGLVIDGLGNDPVEDGSVLIADGVIREVGQNVLPPAGATVIDCQGSAILPGLIDAHVHVGATMVDFGSQSKLKPSSLIALEMAGRLRHMLDVGYTTVRDCGGTDWGFKEAVQSGVVAGPEIIISGSILSQTGGHGDMRHRGEPGGDITSHDTFGMIFSIADGRSALRRAVREQIRLGADFIKVMASGGAASPTDKLERAQYSIEELSLIVEEAARSGLYVAMHALPLVAIRQVVEAGAHTVEHGNFLDDDTAEYMAQRDVALIPTVATYVMASRHPEKYSDPPEVVAKIGLAAEGAMRAVESAYRKGVMVGSGSDLLGDEISWLPHEHELRADIVGSSLAIKAATSVNADILQRPDLGRLVPGCRGDVLVVAGNPLENISILARSSYVRAVVKGGSLWRHTTK